MSSSYYFWKWADNELPGRPAEVHAALLRGELHPALQTFDARPLLKKLESAAARGRRNDEEWDWEITPRENLRKARFVFVTCPELDFPDDVLWRMCKRFFLLDLSGCDAESGRMVDFFLPKLNAFESRQNPDVHVFDIEVDALPALLRQIDPHEPEATAKLTNRGNHFVQCCAFERRFTVEWRENYCFKDWEKFNHWRAGYPTDIESRRGCGFRRKFIPAGLENSRQVDGEWRVEIAEKRQHELLCFSDALRIFQAFLRGEPRPAQYRWVSINHIV